MSLINCPECKQPVSEKAEKCPRCGYTITRKQSAAGIAAAIIIGLVLGWLLLRFAGYI